MAARASDASSRRTPMEAALRHLGARRYGDLVDIIEYAIRRQGGQVAVVLAPLTAPTAVLEGCTPAERAHALWRVVEEGVVHPQVGPPHSRQRRALRAALRLPDEDVGAEWGTSLTERFRQLSTLRPFREATSTQPMEIAWKQGVELLADHLDERLQELRTPEDWAPYRQPRPEVVGRPSAPTVFRRPSEGAQKLIVNLHVLTLDMSGRGVRRRLNERLITSQDDGGLRYYAARAYGAEGRVGGPVYVPTRALWGCRAVHVDEGGVPVTQLWFPRPLRTGERAHFLSEAVLDNGEDSPEGWTDVDVDHYGIEPGELYDGVVPVRGLTIRIRFDPDRLPTAVWWYAEQNDLERYIQPPPGSPRHLDIVGGDVVKTFEQPCQPRESYGITYNWS